MRDLSRADGVVLVKKISLRIYCFMVLDQHHPGASRHPSSAEEGTFPLPCQSIHNLIRA